MVMSSEEFNDGLRSLRSDRQTRRLAVNAVLPNLRIIDLNWKVEISDEFENGLSAEHADPSGLKIC